MAHGNRLAYAQRTAKTWLKYLKTIEKEYDATILKKYIGFRFN